jgi:hypothetical protein
MIFITGDTHGSRGMSRFNMDNFPIQKELTKDDYMIICGDFGLVFSMDNEEKYWLDWLHKKNYVTLWVDGNHEHHDKLDSMPVSEWNGGKVHFINDNVIHLMRGQVFDINSTKIFTFGGADSIDKEYRTEGKSWWKRELPSNAEFEEGLKNLEKNGWMVDVVISHDCSQSVFEKLMAGLWVKSLTSINKYFEILEEKLDYRQWYFGHYHNDKQIDSKHRLMYNQIIKL